jgi:arginyl-tRNA--protein-N-Asp/Glu arginylyltransferase
METLFTYVAPPSSCGYLPDQDWSLEYEMVGEATRAEYEERLNAGWRRFGGMMFRPRCPTCRACQSLRVLVDRFRPNRSQQRALKINAGAVEPAIGKPSVTRAKLRLYDVYHAYQSASKGWPEHPAKDAASYRNSFVDNPFAIEEWCYYLGHELVGVGYVDCLPSALSAIYFYYDPAQRRRSLGTWNVLCLLDEAARRGLPYLYLGYYVAGCPSLEYKSRFVPNEILHPDGRWRPFQTLGIKGR